MPETSLEQLDIVTPTGHYLRTADRREVHDDGHWHQVFHCLVIRPGAPARIVLQRRHQSKAAFPGLLDLSATGHLSAGETPEEGIRELNEELGIDAEPEDLVPVGVRLLVDDEGEGLNRERVHLYFMTDDRPLDQYAPEPTEVESLVEVAAADLLELTGRFGAHESDEVNAGDEPESVSKSGPGLDSIAGVEWRPGTEPFETRIVASDLIKPVDGYWAVILVMADRFAAGHSPIGI